MVSTFAMTALCASVAVRSAEAALWVRFDHSKLMIDIANWQIAGNAPDRYSSVKLSTT
jgi:hypothetical protein